MYCGCGANIRPIIFFKLNLGLAIVVIVVVVVMVVVVVIQGKSTCEKNIFDSMSRYCKDLRLRISCEKKRL